MAFIFGYPEECRSFIFAEPQSDACNKLELAAHKEQVGKMKEASENVESVLSKVRIMKPLDKKEVEKGDYLSTAEKLKEELKEKFRIGINAESAMLCFG